MLVPISWLKEYVDLNMPVKQLADRITLAGLEVEGIQYTGEWWDADHILVGQIVAVTSHPNADRLVLVEVDYGAPQPEQVVTGAPNLFQYKDQEKLPVLKVAFARAGAVLIDAYSDERPRPKKKLKPSKIRGIPSNGMVCSERELGLSDEHEGILLLPEDAPVGMPLRDYYGDEVLELGLTPDMARCLSMIGVAREVSALTDASLHLPPDESPSGNATAASDDVTIGIEDPALCNRYIGMIIRDVQVGEAPAWMQERLTKAGMRPISNVVDITNYVMLEWGQPLHAFDYDLLVGRAKRSGQSKPTIIVRRAQPGEKMTTLDGVERELDESMLLIADTAGPIALAGVMGGSETEVHAGTRNVLLESATFDGINNRRTSQKLKLHSEASQRFTRGIPATLNAIAARRAALLMQKYAGEGGGTAPRTASPYISGMVDTYPVPQEQRIVYTTESEVRRQLGMDVSLPEIATSLQKLDITSEIDTGLEMYGRVQGEGCCRPGGALGLHIAPGEPLLRCIAPWHRLDIQVPADLTEEVARIIGYEHIKTTLMDDVLPEQHRNFVLETEEHIRDILVGCGLQETINYALTTPENHDTLNRDLPSTAERETAFITLVNPLSTKRRVMRRSMLVSALENLEYNYRYTQRLAVFEIGRVYLPEKGGTSLHAGEHDGGADRATASGRGPGDRVAPTFQAPAPASVRPYEESRLCVLITGPRRIVNIHPDPAGAEAFDFFDLKGIVETLLSRLGFTDQEYEFVAQRNHPIFTPACAELTIHNEVQGVLGELRPQIQATFDVPTSARVYVADLRIAPLIRPSWELRPMEKISNYPPVVEDLAFVVPEEVTAHQLQTVIRNAAGLAPALGGLTKVELFDIYRGPPIPAGHKSMAYRLTYESLEGTLREAQVTAIRNRIIQRVAEAVGGTLRE